MKNPPQGTLIQQGKDPGQVYLVVDPEPRNWKSGVGVREMLPAGALGPLRIFDQEDMANCIPVVPEKSNGHLAQVA